jgi:glutamate synthase domain-containing protein 3
MDYRELNGSIKEIFKSRQTSIILNNVNGQRYIGNALRGEETVVINGVPGNDLGMFIDGPSLIVNGNVQDGVANTMNDGLLVVAGNAGDTLGYGMRGGEVFIRGNAGYRAGIHMKEYGVKKPLLVIGLTAGDFLGEYMAGGTIIVFNLENEIPPMGSFCGAGMHGGTIYIRGSKDSTRYQDLNIQHLDEKDLELLDEVAVKYENHFDRPVPAICASDYIKIIPHTNRPYRKLYVGV